MKKKQQTKKPADILGVKVLKPLEEQLVVGGGHHHTDEGRHHSHHDDKSCLSESVEVAL